MKYVKIMNFHRWRLFVLISVSPADGSEGRGRECETAEEEMC